MDGLTISRSTGMINGNVSELGTSNKSSGLANSLESNDQSFANTLKTAVGAVNDLQKSSDIQMQKLATGQSTNIHGVMIAADKADIALRLLVQVRNKMIEAYQDVMKMQV